jgi:cyclophilin family peptidyl-prolyl cis-trans isomerase
MKKTLLILSALLIFLGIFSCSDGSGPAKDSKMEVEKTVVESPESKGAPFAIIETDKGNITIELLVDTAPKTVANFIELAEVGFYKRTTFHRVMKDRMIQGGDPLSRDRNPYNDGQGTSGSYIPQEFSKTEVDRGTVAMGREEFSDNGGSCQFFVVLKRTPEWDGQYNVFGKVSEGIEIVEEISRSPLTKSDRPDQKYRPAGKQIIKNVTIEYR